MWRIDDLVDLCQDARSGALNGVLLEPRPKRDAIAARAPARLDGHRRAAAEAAESLLAGAAAAAGAGHAQRRSFLSFIQRYAGIAPRPS